MKKHRLFWPPRRERDRSVPPAANRAVPAMPDGEAGRELRGLVAEPIG